MLLFVCWCLLLLFSWPLAVLVLVLAPFLWLLSLPLRVIGVTMSAVLALLAAVLMFPARVLRGRR